MKKLKIKIQYTCGVVPGCAHWFRWLAWLHIWWHPKKAMESRESKEIYLQGGPMDGRRVFITKDIEQLHVPVYMEGGFGQIIFRRTDLKTNDGIEIWKPRGPE